MPWILTFLFRYNRKCVKWLCSAKLAPRRPGGATQQTPDVREGQFDEAACAVEISSPHGVKTSPQSNDACMAIKKSDLYSSIWASCDELRGGMDARRHGAGGNRQAPFQAGPLRNGG